MGSTQAQSVSQQPGALSKNLDFPPGPNGPAAPNVSESSGPDASVNERKQKATRPPAKLALAKEVGRFVSQSLCVRLCAHITFVGCTDREKCRKRYKRVGLFQKYGAHLNVGNEVHSLASFRGTGNLRV